MSEEKKNAVVITHESTQRILENVALDADALTRAVTDAMGAGRPWVFESGDTTMIVLFGPGTSVEILPQERLEQLRAKAIAEAQAAAAARGAPGRGVVIPNLMMPPGSRR